jgi:hypothetical protein
MFGYATPVVFERYVHRPRIGTLGVDDVFSKKTIMHFIMKGYDEISTVDVFRGVVPKKKWYCNTIAATSSIGRNVFKIVELFFTDSSGQVVLLMVCWIGAVSGLLEWTGAPYHGSVQLRSAGHASALGRSSLTRRLTRAKGHHLVSVHVG